MSSRFWGANQSGLRYPLSVAFTPLSLFAGAAIGAWYDPSDLATLFQDSAGTTPVTANNDPVGKMLDKSGNGFHLTQATAGKRPLYKVSGGLSSLLFDGTDDFLQSGAFTAWAQPSSFLLGEKLTSIGAAQGNFITGTGQNTLYKTATDSKLALFAGGTALVFDAANTSAHVLHAEFNGLSATLRRDGSAVAATSGTGVGSQTMTQVTLGSDDVGANLAPYSFYGAILVNRLLTAIERGRSTSWLGLKAGLAI
jgi:hypothetical protein